MEKLGDFSFSRNTKSLINVMSFILQNGNFIVVIIVLSINTQSLCDILIGRELNEITPTAADWTFYDKPWGIGLAAIFRSFVAVAKFGLPLSSSGVFTEFETRQQEKKMA